MDTHSVRGGRSEVATGSLLVLDGFEECLEVTGAEALMVAALDDFDEESWSVLHRLRKDLQKISLLVVVNEDLLVLNHVDVLLDLEVDAAEALPQVVVIGVWNLI